MQDATHAHATHWTEYRTPSGRWSKIRHGEVIENYLPHMLRNFFSAKFPGERREYAYFEQGYLPSCVAVPSPNGTERRVYLFFYYTGTRDVTHYTYED